MVNKQLRAGRHCRPATGQRRGCLSDGNPQPPRRGMRGGLLARGRGGGSVSSARGCGQPSRPRPGPGLRGVPGSPGPQPQPAHGPRGRPAPRPTRKPSGRCGASRSHSRGQEWAARAAGTPGAACPAGVPGPTTVAPSPPCARGVGGGLRWPGDRAAPSREPARPGAQVSPHARPGPSAAPCPPEPLRGPVQHAPRDCHPDLRRPAPRPHPRRARPHVTRSLPLPPPAACPEPTPRSEGRGDRAPGSDVTRAPPPEAWTGAGPGLWQLA